MLKWMRVGALVAAGITAVLLVIGDHPPEFVVADILLVLALLVAAALPAERGALPWLMAGFAFAAGVFTVAFAASVADSALNVPVGLAAVACVVAVASGTVAQSRA